MNFKDVYIEKINLHLFDGNTNLTISPGLSDEMKTYYSDYLIDNAEPNLVHDQFAQKQNIPKNGGKTIEFRKYTALEPIKTPLEEGVTPTGQSLSVAVKTATVAQYGGFIQLSDMLLMTAIDNTLVMATKLLGSQAGRTLDAITRDVITANCTAQRHEGEVALRTDLVGGQTSGNHYLTVKAVKNAVRTLKRQNAEKIGGSFVGIIHPDVASDLMDDPEWKYPHQYQDTTNLYEGEIGKVQGVRFVETTEAKIEEGKGKNGANVYITLVLGANAYGTTEITGGGLEHIVKQLGSGGATDPLNQRATVGWKATKAAISLSPEYIVGIETTSSYK